MLFDKRYNNGITHFYRRSLTMSDRAKLSLAIPVIPALDVVKAINFYEEKLGFAKDFDWGNPVDYGGVIRDGIEIHLFRCEDTELAKNMMFRIMVKNIEALYAEYQGTNVIHTNGALEIKPWGYKEFGVADLDGVCITFCEEDDQSE